MPILTTEERQQKEAALAAKIKSLLPDFVKPCRANDDAVIIHQDSFAADYQDDEYAPTRDGDQVSRNLREGSPHYRNKQRNTQRVEETRVATVGAARPALF